MAVLTVVPISRVGVAGTLVAAGAGGDSFANTGKEYFEVVNGGGAPITVTIPLVTLVDGTQTVTSRAVVVTNAQRRLIGPFPIGAYNDVNGRVNFTYSGVTSVTCNPFSVTPE